MNKKIIMIIALMCCACLLLTGCGTGSQTNGTEAAPKGKDRVVIYTAAEDERIAYIQEELNKEGYGLRYFLRPGGCERRDYPERKSGAVCGPQRV